MGNIIDFTSAKAEIQENQIARHMATLTVRKALEANIALNQLIVNDKENKFVFPSVVRIRLALNLRKLRPVVEEFQKENTELIKKYGTQVKDKEGNDIEGQFQVGVKSENRTKFDDEQKALVDSDSEVSLSPITDKDLSENQLSVDLIAALYDVGLLVEKDQ